MVTTTQCLNIDFKSTRPEDFFDIQLTVKGCKSLVESFQRYVRPHRMSRCVHSPRCDDVCAFL
jgi:hypothetical protein